MGTVFANFDCENPCARYYFYHIPKTAGTSLNAILSAIFAPEDVCPPHLWHDLMKLESSALEQYRLFRGHFYSGLNQVVDFPLRAFVFLRDPLERALSHYGHVIKFPDHYLHRRGKDLGSLGAFLSDPETRETVRNFQAKCLVATFDARALAKELSVEQLEQHALERLIETTPIDMSDAELLDRAKEALRTFCCLGITERFEDSVRLLCQKFGWEVDVESALLNTNDLRPRASELDPEVLKLLSELNAVDIELYSYAVSLFEELAATQEKIASSARKTIISYAQNFEDVMLWRALGHVENGFYIDVGANDPCVDSVTRAFYECGWRGINIEPIESHFYDLVRERPRDLNLKAAAGAAPGEIEVWECDVRGWATASASVIDRHRSEGHRGRFQKVSVSRLSDICEAHAPCEIHFIKIDVEGFERQVLEGMNFERFRPWVVVVEAMEPNSSIPAHEEWEKILLAARYIYAYGDGLNRFYVADEHSELLAAFRYPPNVFDEFRLAAVVAAEQRSAHLELLLKTAERTSQEADRRAHESEERAQEAARCAQKSEERAQEAVRCAQEAERTAKLECERRLMADALAQAHEQRAAIAEALATERESAYRREDARRHEAEGVARQAESRLDEAVEQLRGLKATEDALRKDVESWHARVLAIYGSTSWRITRPLRGVKRLLVDRTPNAASGSVRSISQIGKLVGRQSLAHCIRFVLQRPTLKRNVDLVLRKCAPNAKAHLSLFANNVGLISRAAQASWSVAPNSSSLAASALADRVAVVIPISTSGTIGGAERFYSGLVRALVAAGYPTDVIAEPFDESSFESIQEGYARFEALDLTAYDLVISTKAPTYAVKHRNHVLYLVHTVRVFYDMFDEVFPNANATLCAQREWIHKRDTEAFARIKHRFSIGAEVSRRLREWNNCDAEVLHPPIDVDGLFDQGIGDYFFMPGRLHAWKRVDLAIRAIRKSTLPLRLVISGEGEAEASLRELAGNDSRIEFLGRVDDDALRKLYAGALAIPFLPLREDYGYVTLEAFASGKPVVTCVDSGEPTAFVDDGISGFVCQPDPQALCEAFERLWTDRKLAARMGRSGRERIASINWSSVVGKLLQAGFPESVSSTCTSLASLKVAVLDMQPITPAVGGGRLRLLGLYHELGSNIDVRYVGTYDWPGESYRRHKITPTLEEINVPLSAAHHEAAAAAARDAGGKTVIDMLFHRQAHLSDDYLEEAFRAVEWADVVVFSHPWVAPLVADSRLVGKVVVYDSQNVERNLRAQLLDVNNPFERSVLDEVERAERVAGDRADLILACSEDDAKEFSCYYRWNRADIAVVPNGVFASTLKPASQDEKSVARQRLGVAAEEIVAFFIGSDYAPNVEAAEIIARVVAPACRDVTFVVAGGVCEKIGLSCNGNLRAIGFVDDEHRRLWLHAADFALNPMCSGSGTNIKMFDFMAAGLPVVTTATGARGIASASIPGLHIVDVEQMASFIHSLIEDQSCLRAGGAANRALVEDRFSWEQISPALGQRLKSAWTRKEGMRLLSDGAGGHRVERLAHLTTMGLKCGIGEYTRKIVDIFEAAGITNLVLSCDSALEKSVEPASGPDFRIAWYFDNESWGNSSIKDDTIIQLVDWGAQGILIQYHPGFFSPAKLETFIAQCLAAKVRVAVVVHNFTAACVEVFGNLNKWGVPIFSHRKTEIDEARSSGVVLEFVPIGVDAREMDGPRSIDGRDFEATPPKIVTNGFLRAHKGVRVLIDALPIVHRSFPGATVRVQCPLYSSEDSSVELVACQARVDAAALGDYVQIDTRFLPKSDLLRELATADVAVLPYLVSDEGGSASATDAIAVGLPLIVSTAEIFDGVRDVCETVEPTPEAVAGVIVKVLGNLSMYDALASSSFRYARENSWKLVAGSYLTAFCES